MVFWLYYFGWASPADTLGRYYRVGRSNNFDRLTFASLLAKSHIIISRWWWLIYTRSSSSPEVGINMCFHGEFTYIGLLANILGKLFLD